MTVLHQARRVQNLLNKLPSAKDSVVKHSILGDGRIQSLTRSSTAAGELDQGAFMKKPKGTR
jgi:hypothetical protein